jgi:hypothetical protein
MVASIADQKQPGVVERVGTHGAISGTKERPRSSSREHRFDSNKPQKIMFTFAGKADHDHDRVEARATGSAIKD